MATRHIPLGPFGTIVRENLAARRAELNLTAQAVADRTSKGTRPLGRSAVSEIERGARRVDVDDLIALAVALETSPADLLVPPVPGTVIDLGQGDLTLLSGQVRRWLAEGGDVRAVAQPGYESEAELAIVNTEINKLEKLDKDREVLIGVLYDKLGESGDTGRDPDQIQTMIREETEQRQRNRRRRDTLELRKLELQADLRKETT